MCLKEEQLAAVKGVYEGPQDVFVCLLTGYGKSRACVTKSCHKLGGSKAILVVSPLVALIEDHVYILKKHGVRASILGSSLRFFHFCGQGKHRYS